MREFSPPISPYDYFLRDIKLVLLYLLAGAIVPLALMYLALETNKEAAVRYAWYFVVGSAAVGIASVYYFFHREKKTPGEDDLRSKLLARLNAGQPLMTEALAPLTSDERSRIKSLKFWSLTAISVGLGIGLWIVNGISTAKLPDPQNLYVTIGVGALFVFLIYRYGQVFERILKKGEKTLVRGTITDKYNQGGVFGKYRIVVGRISYRQWRWSYLASHIGEQVELVVLKDFGSWVLKRTTIPKSPFAD